MITLLKKLLRKEAPKNDFSLFFNEASAREKKKLFKEVVREANEDQKILVDQGKITLKPKTT